MGVGAAIAGGAALSAGASIIGGGEQSSAAQSAANTQAQASEQAIQAQQQEQQQIRSDLMPFTQGPQTNADLSAYENFGLGANSYLNQLQQLQSSALPGTMTEAQLEQTPGYQFDLSQGLKSTQSANAAKGLGVSGAALKDAATYATGLADNTYQNQFGIQQQRYGDIAQDVANSEGDLNSEFNYLASPVQTAQNSAALTASTGVQTTNAITNAMMAGANARAAGTVGSANAMSGALGGVGSAASGGISNYMLSQALSNSGGSSGGGGNQNFVDSGTFSD